LTPAKLRDGTTKDYGFGWHLGNYHGHRLAFHGGAWQGFKSFIIRFLDTELTIIFLANSWETRDFKLARRLAAAFYPAFALPNITTIDDTDPKTTSLIRRALMEDKQFNVFSLPAAIIHSSELIERKTENNLRVYRYLLTDIDRSAICTIKLKPDDTIASIQLVQL
jgi:Beta-lactamase.